MTVDHELMLGGLLESRMKLTVWRAPTDNDGIVNFLHYPEAEAYPPVHKLLTENTDHLIFLSSYRVYADLQHPITEEAP